MSDPTFISEDFASLVARTQDQSVAEIDKQFEAQRLFVEEQRRLANSPEKTMSQLLHDMVDDSESKRAAVEALNAKITQEALEATKKENPGVPLEERFPAPPITE